MIKGGWQGEGLTITLSSPLQSLVQTTGLALFLSPFYPHVDQIKFKNTPLLSHTRVLFGHISNEQSFEKRSVKG